MTPKIHKIAYVQSAPLTGPIHDGYVLFENNGEKDVIMDFFFDEKDLLSYLNNNFTKVGDIVDYGLYIQNK